MSAYAYIVFAISCGRIPGASLRTASSNLDRGDGNPSSTPTPLTAWPSLARPHSELLTFCPTVATWSKAPRATATSNARNVDGAMGLPVLACDHTPIPTPCALK